MSILGVPVDLVTRTAVEAWLRSVMTGADGASCRHLVTLNPEYVMASMRDAEFQAALRNADLATADGAGIAIAVRWIYHHYPPRETFARVTGVDVMEMIGGISADEHIPVYLLGAGRGVADAAAARLSERYPGFVVAGTWDGGTPGDDSDEDSRTRIRDSGAMVVLVAYGAPGQIHWIARNQQSLAEAGVRVVVGVGGSFDFISGTVRRAPEWVRRMGLEWLYRLLREPWRWRRQLVLPHFALRVGVIALRERFRPEGCPAPDV